MNAARTKPPEETLFAEVQRRTATAGGQLVSRQAIALIDAVAARLVKLERRLAKLEGGAK